MTESARCLRRMERTETDLNPVYPISIWELNCTSDHTIQRVQSRSVDLRILQTWKLETKGLELTSTDIRLLSVMQPFCGYRCLQKGSINISSTWNKKYSCSSTIFSSIQWGKLASLSFSSAHPSTSAYYLYLIFTCRSVPNTREVTLDFLSGQGCLWRWHWWYVICPDATKWEPRGKYEALLQV
jgi:hypothetical protein